MVVIASMRTVSKGEGWRMEVRSLTAPNPMPAVEMRAARIRRSKFRQSIPKSVTLGRRSFGFSTCMRDGGGSTGGKGGAGVIGGAGLFQEIGITADIGRHHAGIDMQHLGGEVTDEMDVVGNEHQGAFITFQREGQRLDRM